MHTKNSWKKDVTLYLVGQTISLFGSTLVQFAITWYITMTTQSGLMITISVICGFLPTFFLSPFAGVWADRYNRKIIIILADSLIALSTLAMAILFLMGYDSLWLLFVMSSIRAIGAGIQTPAVSALIPQLVPEDKLIRINSINGTIQSIISLASPMLSGLLLSFASIEAIFFVDVVTAAIAVLIMLFFLKIKPHAKASEKQKVGYFEDFKLGVDYIKNHSFVKRFFIFCALFFFLVSPAAFMTPLQVSRTFGNDVWRLTAVEMAFSIGMTVGGAIMLSWGGFKNRVHTMILSSFTFAVCTVVLGIVPDFWIYLAVMCFTGSAVPVFNIPSMVMLQEKVEENFLGRVFGVMGMITSSVMPLGMIIFGPVSDVIRIEWILIATGISMFALSIFLSKSKTLLKAGEQPLQTSLEQKAHDN